MKKSEAYKIAQVEVLMSLTITPEEKLEVLRILMDDEAVAKYGEEQATKKAAVEE